MNSPLPNNKHVTSKPTFQALGWEALRWLAATAAPRTAHSAFIRTNSLTLGLGRISSRSGGIMDRVREPFVASLTQRYHLGCR
jgi:hypothetical protein